MTADPDVLGLDDEVVEAWSGLTHHHYRHLPVVDDGQLVGVVSIRDLLTVAQIRPADEVSADVPRGLEGVVVAETSVGDVRGTGGVLPLPAVLGHRPGRPPVARGRLAAAVRRGAPRPGRLGPVRRRGGRPAGPPRRVWPRCCPPWPSMGSPLDVLRTGVSILGAELGWRPDPRHRPPRAAGPGPPPLRGGPHPARPPSTASSRARTRSRPGTTCPTPPTTCGCCRARRPRPTMSGPSSST